jgi:hypothetical protein
MAGVELLPVQQCGDAEERRKGQHSGETVPHPLPLVHAEHTCEEPHSPQISGCEVHRGERRDDGPRKQPLGVARSQIQQAARHNQERQDENTQGTGEERYSVLFDFRWLRIPAMLGGLSHRLGCPSAP